MEDVVFSICLFPAKCKFIYHPVGQGTLTWPFGHFNSPPSDIVQPSKVVKATAKQMPCNFANEKKTIKPSIFRVFFSRFIAMFQSLQLTSKKTFAELFQEANWKNQLNWAVEQRETNPEVTFHWILIGLQGSLYWLIIIPIYLDSIIPYIKQPTRVFWTLLSCLEDSFSPWHLLNGHIRPQRFTAKDLGIARGAWPGGCDGEWPHCCCNLDIMMVSTYKDRVVHACTTSDIYIYMLYIYMYKCVNYKLWFTAIYWNRLGTRDTINIHKGF